ncbi:hypothetical protein D3C73_185840 [compost metagenome]
MARKHLSSSLSQRNWQDMIYDGMTDTYEDEIDYSGVEYLDERYVSSYMLEGINDCIEYIEDHDENTYWIKEDPKGKDFYKQWKKDEERHEIYI